LVIHKTMHL